MSESALPAERKLTLHDPAGPSRKKALNLLDRAQLVDRLSRELHRSKSGVVARYSLLYVDLDRFRIVNTSLGRQIGDDLLNAISVRLNDLLGPHDCIARTGGDEFAIVIEELGSRGSALNVAESMQKELIRGFNISGTVVYSTASIGIARIGSPYMTAEEILRDAEIAMYNAKARGRARAEPFHAAMRTKALYLFELETDLRRAVERGEFELFYQPIVSSTNGRVHAFESLLRWRHPSRGLLSPGSFLDLLKETGLIVPVGEWVINEACRQARVWQDMRNRPIPVTINLASQQFTHANVVNTVSEAIEKSGVDPLGIVLELTEDAILEDLTSAKQTLSPLRARGVRIMIDDFGTGYSSLSYLRRLSVDAIKIDASFVDRIDRFAEDRMIVRAIVALAHALDLVVVAEGIERNEQLTELVNLECEEVQGFMIAAPVNAVTATRMIESKWTAAFAV